MLEIRSLQVRFIGYAMVLCVLTILVAGAIGDGFTWMEVLSLLAASAVAYLFLKGGYRGARTKK